MLEIIPEESITEAMTQISGPSTFQNLLQYGTEFKMAGLKPIYILDCETKEMYVTSVERIQKIFH